jgi:phosphoesterase RecJ-like protein
MQYGADLAGITHRTMVRMPTSLIRLYSRVLPKMRLEDGVIWVAVEQADLDASGTGPGDYTGLSSYLIQADEAFISASFAEIAVNGVECSFRAVPGFDVSQIALSLGGGGHVLASGCILHGTTLEKAVEQVIPLLKAEARRGKSFYDR